MKLPQKPPSMASKSDAGEAFLLFARYEAGETDLIPSDWYYHWDTLKHLPAPLGVRHSAWWHLIKMTRAFSKRAIPLVDVAGRGFSYTIPDPMMRMLHRLDQMASGAVSLPEPVTDRETRERYIQTTLIDEAFASSALEGAVSTREKAQAMIREGREPRDHSERMILNNYLAMALIRDVRDRPLTLDLVVQLRQRLTEGTIEGDTVFRQPGDGIGVYDDRNTLLHAPPPAEEIPARIEAMCAFANRAETGPFLHPVVKAIALHFWLAYDHPFVDGNGRTARALFYWMMLRQGFWLAEFISISAILRQAPSKYARSFLYTETDDNDLTYFLLAQLRVIERSVDALHEHLARKADDLRQVQAQMKATAMLNVRQTALVSHALRYPNQAYTIQSHQRSHGVGYDTARLDLLDLDAKGLLVQGKRGKKFVFTPAPDLATRLRALE